MRKSTNDLTTATAEQETRIIGNPDEFAIYCQRLLARATRLLRKRQASVDGNRNAPMIERATTLLEKAAIFFGPGIGIASIEQPWLELGEFLDALESEDAIRLLDEIPDLLWASKVSAEIQVVACPLLRVTLASFDPFDRESLRSLIKLATFKWQTKRVFRRAVRAWWAHEMTICPEEVH